MSSQPAALLSMIQRALAPLELYGQVSVVPGDDGGIIAFWQSHSAPNAVDIQGSRELGFMVAVVWELESGKQTAAVEKATKMFGRMGIPILTEVHRHYNTYRTDGAYHFHFQIQKRITATQLRPVLEYIVQNMPRE